MSWSRLRKEKTQEAIKRELLLKNAKEQFKRLNHFGLGFPVIVWRV